MCASCYPTDSTFFMHNEPTQNFFLHMDTKKMKSLEMYHNFRVNRYDKSGKCLCIMKSIHALLSIESVGLYDVLPRLINQVRSLFRPICSFDLLHKKREARMLCICLCAQGRRLWIRKVKTINSQKIKKSQNKI